MIDASSESFLHESEAISFDARDVTVEPGENTIQLKATMTSCASFIFDKIRLELGKLVLTHSLRSAHSPITVEANHPSLEMDVSLPVSPIVGQIQAIHVTFTTNDDFIYNGMLSVSSSTGLEILDIEQGCLCVRDDKEESDWEWSEFTFKDGRLAMPDCSPHRTIQLAIPVRAPIGTQSHEVCSLEFCFMGY